MKLTKRDGKAYALYFVSYCSLGAFIPLLSQYLSEIGFSGTEIGSIVSEGTAVAVVSGMIWGKVYANSGRKKYLIMFMFAACAVSGFLSSLAVTFAVFAFIYGLMQSFQGPVYGICDTFTISNGRNFSVVRSFGAVGYALSVYVGGIMAEAAGLKSIFYIYFVAMAASAVIVVFEEEPPHCGGKGEKVKLSELLGEGKYVKLLLCAFFVMGTNSANGTYFGFLYRYAGGTVEGIGVAFLLMAGSEAPFMLLIPRIKKSLSSESLIFVGILVMAAKYLIYCLFPYVPVLLATFFLQGISNGIILVELVDYFGKIVDRRLSGMAVTTFYAVGNSLSTIIWSLLGGIVLDYLGARGVYVVFCAAVLLGALMYWGMGFLRKNRVNEQGEAGSGVS